MKKQVHIFLTALMFYTRIPCPKWVDHNPDYLDKATRYLPIIGWIVGAISFLTYYASIQLFSPITALILSFGASVLTTGGFHEDGFCDVCDGFGGGWTQDKILTIMKDSRVGTYGVLGIILLLGAKISSLYTITRLQFEPVILGLIFISAHSLSRLTAGVTIKTHEYVREDAQSKVKPIAKSMSNATFVPMVIFGLLPLLILCFILDLPELLLILVALYFTKFFLARYFKKWIGGYTGDCLGAIQQVSELVFYLSIIAIWRFTL